MGDDATLRPCPTLDDVRHVHSHPVALNQCRRFIAAHRLSPVAGHHYFAGDIALPEGAQGQGFGGATVARVAPVLMPPSTNKVWPVT